jgi:2',3'-cyclic-nucleotide 2'-phosphodiesterase
VTDVGMTGGRESILGFDREDFLGLFLERGPTRIGVSKGPADLNAVLIEVKIDSGRAVSIERVYREHVQSYDPGS